MQKESFERNANIFPPVDDAVAQGGESPRQLDLGFGMYEMCPFPLSFMHACETSDQCKQTGCCAQHAFPGTRRWQRPCCVVSRLVTLARLTGSCIKSKTPSPESACPANLVVDECGDPCDDSGDCKEPGLACCPMTCDDDRGSYCHPVHANAV
ncbi:keratin-associated protein 10-7-like [Ixodes scapularis]|uniref:keratin-associated protein 10-7-like n=1 Tax=Ixodes scapularis TaxID=6945 RepID=UPI001A9EBEAD|nr:keratin-associated protein 10-7-like [Ixodes scapularis]